MTAEVAENGRQAVQALEGKRYGLVFMDCQMPEMNGYDAAEEIRRREGDARRTPIIALTAHAMESERAHVLAAGMDDCVTKPVGIAVLRTTVARWMVRSSEGPPSRFFGEMAT